MSSGLKDTRTSYEVPNRGPAAWVHFGSYEEWDGEDRPQGLRYPPKNGKERHRFYRVLRRIEGHNVHVTVNIPLKWEGDWTAEERAAADTFNSEHAYFKEWESRSLGTLDIYSYQRSDDSLWDTWLGTISSAGAGPTIPPDPWTEEDDYKIIDKLYERVNGSDFNLASFLGAEGMDTVKFIGDTANRLYRAGLAVKRGQFNRSLSILRDFRLPSGERATRLGRKMALAERKYQLAVYKDSQKELLLALTGMSPRDADRSGLANLARVPAKSWLEWHLAAEPLLGDVYAAAEQLAHRLNVPAKRVYSARRQRKSRQPFSVFGETYGMGWTSNIRTRRKNVKYIVQEEVSIPQLLGLYNPEVILWNAMPLTFVSDYMLPIGQWLEARANAQKLSGVFVVSEKDDWTANGLAWRNDPAHNPVYYSRIVRGDAYSRSGWFRRTVHTSLPVPLPKLHPLGAVRSWQRAATSISLLVGAFTGGNSIRHLR